MTFSYPFTFAPQVVTAVDRPTVEATGSVDATPVAGTRVRGNLRLDEGGAVGGDGDFAAAQVVALLRQRLSPIRACYETQLRQDPQLAGRVTVQFTIQTDGGVSRVFASENTTGSQAVAACVVSVAEAFRWSPAPEGGSVTFSYSFVFAPQN